MKSTVEDVFAAKLPMSELSSLTDHQIGFLLTASRISNDVLALQRTMIAHQNGNQNPLKAERDAQVLLWASALNMLGAKLWEAWEAVRHFSSLWKCEKNWSADTLSQRLELNQHFSNGSPLSVVRNKSAFHYDKGSVLDGEVKEFRRDIGKGESLDWILGGQQGNTLYLFVMGYHTFSLLDALWPQMEKQVQMDKLRDSTTVAVDAMTAFLGNAIADLISMVDAQTLELDKIDMTEMMSWLDTELPFLVKID
jgi:hypothetical protein